MARGRSDDPSKQNYNPAVIHQRFGESKILVVTFPLKPRDKPDKAISSCYARECEKMASSWSSYDTRASFLLSRLDWDNLYPSFRKSKQTNKQTNKRKTKQNKAKPKNTVKAQGVSYLARKDKTTSLFLLLLFIIVHIICFALNVNKMEKKH